MTGKGGGPIIVFSFNLDQSEQQAFPGPLYFPTICGKDHVFHLVYMPMITCRNFATWGL